MKIDSKILDVRVKINDKNVPVLNTEMDISVSWDVDVSVKDNSAEVKVDFLKVFGSFEWVTIAPSYRKKTKIEFSTDETWKITHNKDYNFKIQPMLASIDFDTKEIKIQLV